MIQLPPLLLNQLMLHTTQIMLHFFWKDNNPVEVGLSVTLREIVPIYKQDVEAGC